MLHFFHFFAKNQDIKDLYFVVCLTCSEKYQRKHLKEAIVNIRSKIQSSGSSQTVSVHVINWYQQSGERACQDVKTVQGVQIFCKISSTDFDISEDYTRTLNL